MKLNAKGDEKYHVYCCLTKPWLLASHQLESTIIAGRFVPSEVFSNHINKIIAPLGVDKDEAQTSMMQRFANREVGNSNECVGCLAYYEKGSESYHNLSITFLKKGSAICDYVQLMLNNCYFVFQASITDGAVSDAKTLACSCKFLNLFEFCGTSDQMFPQVEMNLQAMTHDVFCSREDHVMTCEGLECVGLDLGHERLWNKGIIFSYLIIEAIRN